MRSWPFADRPAVTRRDLPGDGGSAWYASTLPDDATLGSLLDDVLAAAGMQPAVPGVPRGVEATRRSDGSRSWLFVLNHTDEPQAVAAGGYDLVADATVDGTVRLARGGVAVIRED
ncbi:hypothetical protein GCM10009740_19800 [Terrabacter terrae]|uniref:Beta-galactosidase C-terminal domain-containing protein n=1 Tax=Terrabacter terrae TaxID=318434 RepID=A0ABN3GP52_9MICO